MKKGLKSVYIYQSYYKNKLGGPFFWTTLYIVQAFQAFLNLRRANLQCFDLNVLGLWGEGARASPALPVATR